MNEKTTKKRGVLLRLGLLSGAVSCGAYTMATYVAHESVAHQEFWLIYGVITVSAVMHLLAELKTEPRPPDDHTPTAAA